ncbi:unnamed protein product [Moneuplotes crassus]|uniref:Uncharacterized protein n=1 Tax=Euplotes crassus TaxID=5936 RepID=A0AAD1XJI7_EUPCR|nr:unnamed protein product [Moneuplotes crassus]
MSLHRKRWSVSIPNYNSFKRASEHCSVSSRCSRSHSVIHPPFHARSPSPNINRLKGDIVLINKETLTTISSISHNEESSHRNITEETPRDQPKPDADQDMLPELEMPFVSSSPQVLRPRDSNTEMCHHSYKSTRSFRRDPPAEYHEQRHQSPGWSLNEKYRKHVQMLKDKLRYRDYEIKALIDKLAEFELQNNEMTVECQRVVTENQRIVNNMKSLRSLLDESVETSQLDGPNISEEQVSSTLPRKSKLLSQSSPLMVSMKSAGSKQSLASSFSSNSSRVIWRNSYLF